MKNNLKKWLPVLIEDASRDNVIISAYGSMGSPEQCDVPYRGADDMFYTEIVPSEYGKEIADRCFLIIIIVKLTFITRWNIAPKINNLLNLL